MRALCLSEREVSRKPASSSYGFPDELVGQRLELQTRKRMTQSTFIQKWGPGGPAFHLNEEQGAWSHFADLRELLAVPKPGFGNDPHYTPHHLLRNLPLSSQSDTR